MAWQGLYFYTDPNTRITYFLEFDTKKNDVYSLKTSGFLVDYLLATPPKIAVYNLKIISFAFLYKGLLVNTFQKLKRRKKLIQEITFEYEQALYTGIINPSDTQIIFSIKIKGNKHLYRVYSVLDKTATTKLPAFLIGDSVCTLTEKGHTYREGTIFKYEWHYLYKEWMYFILEGKAKEQPKRYFAWDLEKI